MSGNELKVKHASCETISLHYECLPGLKCLLTNVHLVGVMMMMVMMMMIVKGDGVSGDFTNWLS